MGVALFGFIVIPYLVQIAILWLLYRFEKWKPLERFYHTPFIRAGMFAFLVISLLLAAFNIFVIYGEGILLVSAFTFGLPLIFVGFPLVGLIFFCLGKIPQQKLLQVLVGGQTILWSLALLLPQEPYAADASGVKFPINLLLKNIVGVLLVLHYGLQVLLFGLENHRKRNSAQK